MPRLPLVLYTLFAALLFIVGMRELHTYNNPGGKVENLFAGLLTLTMVSGYVFGGLILSDKWKKDEKAPFDPAKPLLPSQKNPPPDK